MTAYGAEPWEYINGPLLEQISLSEMNLGVDKSIPTPDIGYILFDCKLYSA